MPQELPDILKSTYLFENFVSGPNSRMAFAAARKVAERPGQLYNPLVIYGGVGLGKTHLLQAIGNAVSAAHPDWSIVVLNGSQLRVDDIAGAERADLLLFDDLHIGLANHDVQIRLLPLFDRMIGTNRQIAVTTDTSPQKIEALDPKLLSRLLGGVIVALKEIDTNEKVMILSKKAQQRGVTIPDEVLFPLAARVPSNIRELEGALNKVLLYASMFDGPVTREIMDEALPPTVPTAAVIPEPEAAPVAATAAPEEPAGEFGDFITGLDNKVTNLISEQQDAEQQRKEYKDRVFVWRMKGFNTAGIEKYLEQDISVVAAEYDRFTAAVERMVALQQEFGENAAQATPEEIARIESLLFDPDQAAGLEASVRALRQRIIGGTPVAPPPQPQAALAETTPPPVAEPETSPPSGSQAEHSPEPQPAPRPEEPATPQPVPVPAVPVFSDQMVAGKAGIMIETWPWLEDRLIDDY